MGSRIVIEPIAAEDALRESATAEDLAFVGQFSSASRRCEVLAWRAIVRRELGNDTTISHDEYGAPAVNILNYLFKSIGIFILYLEEKRGSHNTVADNYTRS